MKFRLPLILLATLAVFFSTLPLKAEDLKNEFNPITTGVTSLGIAPDARGAAMGDLGAATDPDAYSQFWNPSKYAFAWSKAAVSLSYTPWLRKLVNDIFLANVSGYWKLGSQDNQALSASLRYFSLGNRSCRLLSRGHGYLLSQKRQHLCRGRRNSDLHFIFH